MPVIMSHRLWVGDLSQTVQGSRAAVRNRLVACLTDACAELEHHGLAVSPKSVVLCTHVADARTVVRRLAVKGYRLKVAHQAASLGGDLSGGRRHGRATRRIRASKHQAMSKNIVSFARATRRYRVPRRLELQGAQKAGLHGHELHGDWGGQLQQVRRKLASAVGPRLTGRCLTTLLDLKAPDRDPNTSCHWTLCACGLLCGRLVHQHMQES